MIPEELELEVVNHHCTLPPVVYSHLLIFLCHFRLNNVNLCYNSLTNLQLTISENYFICNDTQISNSYNCLGVAYRLIGEHALAAHAFLSAVEIDPTRNFASQML